MIYFIVVSCFTLGYLTCFIMYKDRIINSKDNILIKRK